MRMILAAAIAASALAAPTLASAGSFESTGYIESVNRFTNTMLIRGGDAYRLPANIDLSQFRTGQRVHVSWNTQNPDFVDLGGDTYIRSMAATGLRAAE
jgi:hypothetical protein